jgi:DNA-binding transcriptional ArsR family regulator
MVFVRASPAAIGLLPNDNGGRNHEQARNKATLMHDVRPDLAGIGALLAVPSRAAILWSLMDGQRRPAGELAKLAGLSPQAATAHFIKLEEGGLITSQTRGRWRYYSLAGPAAAELIERIASFTADGHAALRQTVSTLVPEELRFARCCYDHLAGRLSLQLLDNLRRQGWLLDRHGSFQLTEAGCAAFADLGIDIAMLERGKRPLVRDCLDWSERRPHLAGALGAALLSAFLERTWLVRVAGGRALKITSKGQREMAPWIGA